MKRNVRGNMLVLSGVFVTVNAVGLLIASSFGSLYFVHNRLQTTADELALAGARKLNEQDRLGQMNNMVARSRQLVFDASKTNDTVHSSLAHLNEISDQLHMEARDGATFLETERHKLFTVSRDEATQTMTTHFNQLKEGHKLGLPWLQVSVPLMPQIKFGCTDKVSSNVTALKGLTDLEAADQANYLNPDGSKLYKDNIDAKLNGTPDDDLHFKLSSLPAPVQKDISPARAILAKSYKDTTGDQLYSTVQVQLQLNVDTKLGAEAHSLMQAVGTAEATGGQPML